MDAIRKIEEMPPLPEPHLYEAELMRGDTLTPSVRACWIESHGSNGRAADYSVYLFTSAQLHAYAREYAAQTLASKEAEIQEAALKYVSLFGELQNAMEEIARLKSALNGMLTHMGMDEDEWNKPTFDQARAALRGNQ